jgi:hypothetical protein
MEGFDFKAFAEKYEQSQEFVAVVEKLMEEKAKSENEKEKKMALQALLKLLSYKKDFSKFNEYVEGLAAQKDKDELCEDKKPELKEDEEEKPARQRLRVVKPKAAK